MLPKECRICYEDEQENDNELIYPCACDGTQKYVHEECLAKWRKIKSTEIAFLQCQECKQFYNISKQFLPETLRFNFGWPKKIEEAFAILMANTAFIIFPVIIKEVDKTYLIPKIMRIGESKHLTRFLKKDDICAYFYYYSFFIFLITLFTFFFLFIIIQWKIHYKIRYWRFSSIPFFGTLIFNMHFLYLFFFSFLREFEIYIIGTSTLSVMNIFMILFFLNYHDIIIDRLNSIENKEFIKNYVYPRKRLRNDSEENIVIYIRDTP